MRGTTSLAAYATTSFGILTDPTRPVLMSAQAVLPGAPR